MPAISGVDFWNDSESTTSWQEGPITPGTPYTSEVWVSTDPNSPPASPFSIAFKAYAPPGGGDAAAKAELGTDTPTSSNKEVFAFEGRGGFPALFKQGHDYSPTDQGLLNMNVSPAQVLKYWRAAAIAAAAPGTVTPTDPTGNIAWHYYSQDGVGDAEKQIAAIATAKHTGVYDTITILGFSNGGDAALEVATWLKTKHITVDLAITCDPVPKPVFADFLPAADSSWSVKGKMAQPRPTNVTKWYNFYQQFDTGSLAVADLLHMRDAFKQLNLPPVLGFPPIYMAG